MSKGLLTLFEEYRQELRDWKRAEWANREGGAQVAGMAEYEPIIPSDEAMHNALTGLELLFGVGVKAPVSEAWHNLRNEYRHKCQQADNLSREVDRMQTRELEEEAIVMGFFDWVHDRYYLGERKTN